MRKENIRNLIVLVKYKTQPSKSKEAFAGLTKLIEVVKKEPNFVTIKLHTDPKNDSNILLYEVWSDESYYNGNHMKTKHLRSFMEESTAFLAGPPEISQWKIEKEFSFQ
jgi:quinol monooxygenase YgiN